MSVTCVYQCDGCDAKAESKRLEREFQSVSGRSWGFGTWRYDSPIDAAPAGWVPFDPFTGMTYCPACWHEITSNMEAQA